MDESVAQGKVTAADREQLAKLSEITERGYRARAELDAVKAEWYSVLAALQRNPSFDPGSVGISHW